jgi:ATP-dependent Clp endopeptidase proteolytic subunit ClpP
MTDAQKLSKAHEAALIEKLNAEAKYYKAEAREKEAVARRQEHIARASQFELGMATERNEIRLAGDFHHRFYRFNEVVASKTARECISQLAEWYRIDKADGNRTPHYKVQFNSPGGSVTEGLALFDEIQFFRRQGVKVTTSTVGMAASMAGILLQAGDVRAMAPESWLMIHQASFGAMGQTFEVEDRVAWIKKQQERILDIFAKRAAESDAEKPITRAQLKRGWDRKDWWISSDEALKLGLIDVVR